MCMGASRRSAEAECRSSRPGALFLAGGRTAAHVRKCKLLAVLVLESPVAWCSDTAT